MVTADNDPGDARTGLSEDLSQAEINELQFGLADADTVASAHGQRAAALALAQKGVREDPLGSNNNPYSRYFGFGPQFWCADFVSWAFDRTGNRDRRVPWGPPSAVVNITRWGQSHGYMMSRPEAGAIFTYRNGKHTGIVTGVGGGSFATIEGNTTGPDGSTTYVWTHQRRNDGSYYFIRFPD